MRILASDGTVKIDTDLDDKGLKSGLGKVSSTMGKLGSGALGLAKTGFTALAGAVAATATAMGAGAVAGVKYNNMIEQYQTSFEVMTGSAEKAADVTKQLQELGASTPFEMEDLAQTTQLLMNYGFAADDAIDRMSMLGDISQGSAEKMNRIATAYGQMSSAGKVSLEDVKQMIEAGFNPLQEISQTTGESMSSLYDRISKGTISVDEITASMQRSTSEGGKYFESMIKQSQTFDGQMSTLKDNANQLLGTLTEGIQGKLATELLPMAIDAVDQLSEAFAIGGTEGLIEAGSKILVDVITGIAQAAPGVIDTAVTVIDNIIQGFRDNSATLTQAGMDILSALINGVITLIPSLGGLVLDILGQLAKSFLDNSPKMVEEGKKTLKSITKGISDNLPEMLRTAGDVILTLLSGLTDMLPDIIDMGIELLLSLIDGIANMLPELIPMVVKIIQQIVTALWNNFPKIIQSGVNLILKLLQGIVNAVPGLVSYFPTVISSIIKAFTSINWIKIGVDLIGGIISGIAQAAGNLVKAAVDAAKGAVNAVKGWLGIKSPSRLMRDLIGKNMILGVAVGIDDETPSLIKDVKANMGNVVDEMQMEANKVSLENGITGTYKAISSDVSNTPITTNANFSGEIHTHVELDKKEVGISIAPVVAEELAFA